MIKDLAPVVYVFMGCLVTWNRMDIIHKAYQNYILDGILIAYSCLLFWPVIIIVEAIERKYKNE